MKTPYLTSIISLACVSAYAETVYFQNPGDNWNYITENSSYKDSHGNDLPADWSAEDWANADVIISPEFMNNDHIAGVNADWTVKNLTFADGIGPGNKQYIWWENEHFGHTGAGKTVTVLENVNINTELGGLGQWNWWRWVVGGDFVIDIAATRAARNVTMHGLNGLVIGSETSAGNFIVENVGNFNMHYIGAATEVFGEGVGVKVYGDFTVRNAGYFSMHAISNGLYIKGDLIGENFNIDADHTGEFTFWNINSGGAHIGGNVSMQNIGIFNMINAIGGIYIGGNVELKNNSDKFDISGAQGGVVINKNFIADGIKDVFIENVKGGDGIRINGDISLSNMVTFRANNSDSFYVGGNVTSANNNGWFDVYGIGRIDWLAKGGVHFAGATTDLRGFFGINMEAVGFFRADGDFYTNMIAGETAGLGENDVQIGTLLFNKNFEINGNANLSRSAYIKVGGDFNLKGTANAMFGQTYGADGQMVSSTNVGAEIVGKINFEGNSKLGTWFRSDAENPNKYAKDQFISSSGLNGNGILYTTNENVIDKTGAYSVTYIINSKGDSRFEGGIHQYTAGGNGTNPTHATDLENMRLNVVKNGAGSQALIITEFESRWRGTVTVNEGMLKLYTLNNSDKVKVDLVLNHGTSLEVAYMKEGVHDPVWDTMGYIRAGKLEINGDTKIHFDVSADPFLTGYEADLIEADEVTGSGIATLVIDLDANYFAEGQVLEDFEFKIFQIADNNYEWAQALVRIMYNGADITDKFSKYAAYFKEDGGVYVGLTGVVPEPATVAAILGAIALAFAAYRRR